MLCTQIAEWVANSVDLDETSRSAVSHLGEIYTICSDLSVQIHTVNMAMASHKNDVWEILYCPTVRNGTRYYTVLSNGKRYGKCPKILNTLKFRTPNIFAQNNFWKCPEISNSSSYVKRRFLKFRTQLSSGNFFLLAHSNFGNHFFFFFFFFSLRNRKLK